MTDFSGGGDEPSRSDFTNSNKNKNKNGNDDNNNNSSSNTDDYKFLP
jgi:hypothetical protein